MHLFRKFFNDFERCYRITTLSDVVPAKFTTYFKFKPYPLVANSFCIDEKKFTHRPGLTQLETY